MKRHHLVNNKERHLCGWKRGKKDSRDLMMKASMFSILPNKADLRGSPFISKVEDQGEIGSCTANSSTSAVEFILKKAGLDTQLSRLWLYAKVREFEGTPLSDDSGAEIRDVMKVLATLGCPEEKLYPYNPSAFDRMPPSALDSEAAHHKITTYYRCPTLRTIKAALAQGFPVVGGFQVPESFMSAAVASTGVALYPAKSEGFEGGHAVCFVGFDDSTKMLLAQNSWGTGWGMNGYFWLPYQFVTDGLADDFWSVRRAAI